MADLFDDSGEVQQAYLKVLIYGGSGAGKTYTALQVATALGKTGIVDTERGSEPYRPIFKNPDGTPFSVAPTRSCKVVVTQAIPEAIKKEYACLIVDQVSTMWDDLKDQYILQEWRKQSKAWYFIEKNGKLPFQAWSFIKGPFRKMIRELLDAPMHVFIVARGMDEFQVSQDGGEPLKTGERPEGEKNTKFEPPIMVKMEGDVKKKKWAAFVEKDKWRAIEGQVFINPTAEMFAPVLAKLGSVHGAIPAPAEEEALDIGEVATVGAGPDQLLLIRKLAEKGGVANDVVEKRLTNISRVEAAEIVNRVTLNDWSVFEVKEEVG